MKSYKEMSAAELSAEKEALLKQYEAIKAKGLKLDMSRGKPSAEQLDISMEMMDVLNSSSELASDGVDCATTVFCAASAMRKSSLQI